MLPKRGDILKLDKSSEVTPVRSSSYGGFSPDGDSETLGEDTLLRYLRTINDRAIVQIVNSPDPKVRKMIKILHPNTNTRQSYSIDTYSVSFHCKREEYETRAIKVKSAESVTV